MELMSSMMQKIALLEQKVKSQAQEIQLKARKVAELEKKVKILQKGNGLSYADSLESNRREELEVMCLQLQNQVWEMERFLNDYGLIWVGERKEQLEELKSLKKQENQPAGALWKPGDSTVSNYPINFDLILENLKDLNVLAGEGVSQIEHTAGGARLRQPEAISLTFYQNGIIMFNGPFRSYDEPSTQVTDKRDVFFRERQLSENFPGQGQVVGHLRSSEVKETSEVPGPKLSLEQFLNKLPKSLVRDAKVIDIRRPIKETLQGSDGTRSSEVILVETPSIGTMKERLKVAEQDQPPASNISTLRIKSETGEQTYIVKMLFTETIGDLRQHLAQSRGGERQPYEIISTFPQRVYTDNTMTLQECGLIPNASLLLREKIPSAQEGQGRR
ncbi:UBX domain-containing protein 11 isoform X2 [Carettochelys insculpta]|uniref:UBX domain-containing protein 11 isoform X2 n=1 Tax=Carettochelys insculpta TaxID=44489 RepID=UPI003EB70465